MEIKNKLKKLKEALKEGIFPTGITCNSCGKELFPPDKKYSLCRSCAAAMSKVVGITEREGETVYSCFEYDGVVRKYVLGYKDSDKPYLAEYMARYMYESFVAQDLKADEVTFVPSSPAAKRRRGYDAMRYVAEKFSEFSGLKLNDGLECTDGIDQTKLNSAERAENVIDRFKVKGDFEGTVLLLDDVVTTGATLHACASALKRRGCKVVCLTFARTREIRSDR